MHHISAFLYTFLVHLIVVSDAPETVCSYRHKTI